MLLKIYQYSIADFLDYDFTNTVAVKLSKRNGDVGEGKLEVYQAEMGKFMPACISHWEPNSAKTICSMLGYT